MARKWIWTKECLWYAYPPIQPTPFYSLPYFYFYKHSGLSLSILRCFYRVKFRLVALAAVKFSLLARQIISAESSGSKIVCCIIFRHGFNISLCHWCAFPRLSCALAAKVPSDNLVAWDFIRLYFFICHFRRRA